MLLLSAGTIIFYVFDPQTQPFFPKCPFLAATAYKCPGCGSQRAIHALLHLQVSEAFRQNAFMILLIPYALFGIYLAFFGGKKRFPKAERLFFGKWAAVAWGVFILVFWVGRNIW
ncbi:MAG: DUF2752 domain-containing protein [Petrimonas sp.]|nr:DUF2752 domain-containing protein [Petrimonas sp.]